MTRTLVTGIGTGVGKTLVSAVLVAAEGADYWKPVQAGDLVIGDARVLHAAHANNSDAPRPVLTLWYLPQIDKLSPQLQDRIGNLHLYRCEKIYKQWSQDAIDSIRPLLPTLPAEYTEPEFQRTARWELQV